MELYAKYYSDTNTGKIGWDMIEETFGMKGCGKTLYMLEKMMKEKKKLDCINTRNCQYSYKNDHPTIRINCWEYCKLER